MYCSLFASVSQISHEHLFMFFQCLPKRSNEHLFMFSRVSPKDPMNICLCFPVSPLKIQWTFVYALLCNTGMNWCVTWKGHSMFCGTLWDITGAINCLKAILSGPVGSIIYADLYGSIKIKFTVLNVMKKSFNLTW